MHDLVCLKACQLYLNPENDYILHQITCLFLPLFIEKNKQLELTSLAKNLEKHEKWSSNFINLHLEACNVTANGLLHIRFSVFLITNAE